MPRTAKHSEGRANGPSLSILGTMVFALWIAAAAACDRAAPTGTARQEEPPPPDPVPGTILVVVSTEGPRPDPDGYVVVLDGGPGRTVSANGSVSFAGLTVGAHEVALSGAAPNCPLPNADPRTVTVASGATVEVSISVVCGYLIYVANPSSNDVSVISSVSHQVVETIPVGESPLRPAASPDGEFIYVPHFEANDLSVIETATNQVITTVTVGEGPSTVRFSPDGTLALVANWKSNEVSIIEVASHSVVANVPVGDKPYELAFVPGLDWVYVGNTGSGTLTAIDLSARAEILTANISSRLGEFAITHDGRAIFVAHVGWIYGGKSTVTWIHVGARLPTKFIEVGHNPSHLRMSPDGRYIYTANLDSDDVSVIETATASVIGTIPVGDYPQEIAFAPDGSRAYVVNGGITRDLSVIDMATQSVVASVEVCQRGREAQLTPDGRHAYVLCRFRGYVSVVETATNTTLTTVKVGDDPLGMAIPPW